MDTSKEVTSITGVELPMKGSDSDKGMLVSDVFLNVPVSDGEEWSVACFCEQQHEPDSRFSERMFDSYVRLRASRPRGRTTGFAIYTGDSKDVKSYTETCYGFEVSIKYRTFHLPSCDVEELREDKRPFARIMYAGRLSMGTEDDIALREKYAWELLNTTTEQEYDSTQRKFILEFAGRIFWLDDPGMNREVKEAYKMKTIPLDEYSRQIRIEEAEMIGEARGEAKGEARGEAKGKFEVARSMLADGLPAETIRKYTGLDESSILSLR
jgi:predicted transposase YdaD